MGILKSSSRSFPKWLPSRLRSQSSGHLSRMVFTNSQMQSTTARLIRCQSSSPLQRCLELVSTASKGRNQRVTSQCLRSPSPRERCTSRFSRTSPRGFRPFHRLNPMRPPRPPNQRKGIRSRLRQISFRIVRNRKKQPS